MVTKSNPWGGRPKKEAEQNPPTTKPKPPHVPPAYLLSEDERWEAFEAWHYRARQLFSFLPARETWARRARALGVGARFEEWAERQRWGSY